MRTFPGGGMCGRVVGEAAAVGAALATAEGSAAGASAAALDGGAAVAVGVALDGGVAVGAALDEGAADVSATALGAGLSHPLAATPAATSALTEIPSAGLTTERRTRDVDDRFTAPAYWRRILQQPGRSLHVDPVLGRLRGEGGAARGRDV
jgi:hypothetical protein